MSGPKVVLAIFAGVAAVALFAVAAFLLTDGGKLRCVEGELQDNARRPDGTVLPRVETFSTLAEAEAFICRRIPRPRENAGLTLETVRIARERSLGETIEGDGGVDIEIAYSGPAGAMLDLGVTFPEEPLPSDSGERTSVRGREALIMASGRSAVVRWNRDGFSFAATARLTPDFDLDALMGVLESVR